MKGFLASAPACGRRATLQPHARTSSKFAPLSSTSRGTPSNTASYAVQSFGGGAYTVTDGFYQNVFFVSTTRRPATNHRQEHALRHRQRGGPAHTEYSRPQADHIGIASLVTGPGKPVEVIAREDTKEQLQEASDASRPLPAITFKDGYGLRVGQPDTGAALRRREHARGNICIYAPAQRLLVLIDVVFPWLGPLRVPGRQQQHPRLDREVLAYDFAYHAGGHLGPAGTRADVLVQKGYMQDLRAASGRSTSRQRVIRCRAWRFCKGRLSS